MNIYLSPFRQWRREMNRLFNDLASAGGDGGYTPFAPGQPAVNAWDEGEHIAVEMEIPGVKSDQIDISVTGAELTVKVDRPDFQEEGVTYHRRERPTGSFTRVLELPCKVDAEHVDAQLQDGVLLLKLAKAAAEKPRKILVGAAS
jgi:HSP20 family protein